MAEDKGWICLHRKIQECDLWMEKPFSRGQAWIDLLLLANHEDKKIMFDGNLIKVERGQRITSMRKLSERWGWSRAKVVKFLDVLEAEQMITRKSDTKKTLLTIENYAFYQDIKPPKSHRKATEKPQKSLNNNENNDKQIIVSKDTIYVPGPQEVVELYNSICVDLPFVKTITNARIKTIKTRLRDHSIDELKELFETAQGTPFLKGDNNRGWKAGFDWLMNETNMTKVLEGYYNKTKPKDDPSESWRDSWANA